jgi:GAF domain-containing protein
LEKAVRICDAKFGTLYLHEEGGFRLVAGHEVPEFIESRGSSPIQPAPGGGLDTAMRTKRTAHLPDLAATQSYAERHPRMVEAVELGGMRTVVAVPMLKDNDLVGVIAVFRREVRPFSDKQVALVENFAAQAVIAIENARLLNELRQRTTDLTERTADLTEALEQQTATAEVLQVISSSPGDLEPVFAAMLENAVRICEATFGNIHRWDGEFLNLVASQNTPPAFVEARKRLGMRLRVGRKDPVSRMIATKKVVHIADLATECDYIERSNEGMIAAVELGEVRTMVAVPMLKDDELIGTIHLFRREVRPFTDKQIALVTNFAAQAVIAIENARLLNELRQRTTDLTEALEQQTATSEVLQVISSASGDLEPVFVAMLRNAISICNCKFGNAYLWENNTLKSVVSLNTPIPFANAQARLSLNLGAKNPIARMIATKAVVHVYDEAASEAYAERDPRVVAAVELGGVRTLLVVPMLREGELIGGLTLARQEMRPFNDRQIALVESFAAQAVIAIENTRLLKELRERTDQLAAQSQELAKLNQQLEHRVTDQVGEIERMSRLRRFLPPQVADLIVASGAEKQLESHRREITALFCDLRGFTGFTESADAEDVMALLRDYHAAIGEIIFKYNGTLERYAGDGVMVVFNDPVPVENPALQAVFMALELREAIGALTATWSRLGHEIGFGIGIAHGFATLGTIGFEGRFDYAAIGTVSNVASRLCDEAKPGQILISPRVLMKVENAVKVEPVGEFELKGIRRPLAAYNVVAALASKI